MYEKCHFQKGGIIPEEMTSEMHLNFKIIIVILKQIK